MGSKTPRLGAYGLALQGRVLDPALLVPCPADWPLVEVHVQRGTDTAVDAIDESRAVIALTGGGSLRVERARQRAVFCVPEPLSRRALVHPYLAPVGAVMAHWLGRECLHAGAVAGRDGAWALLGGRGSGKSSLAAWCGLNGFDVVSDDVLVVEGETAFAGPRSVDLRSDAARSLGVGEPLGVVGRRERWRVGLARVAAEIRVSGWIFLAWGERIETKRLSARELLPRLLAHRVLRIPPSRPAALLDLAALPSFELRRPRRWSSLVPAAEQVLEIASGEPRPS